MTQGGVMNPAGILINDSSTHTLYLNGEEKYTPMLLDEHLFKIEDDSDQISA